VRRSTCRIAATRHAQVEQDDMCAPRARAGQSRMKIAEGMTCAPVGNAAACVSVRPVHLRRHAPQVCAHSSPRAHAARTTATGETEFFERGRSFLLPNVRRHLKTEFFERGRSFLLPNVRRHLKPWSGLAKHNHLRQPVPVPA
jgi:hypothetical protein